MSFTTLIWNGSGVVEQEISTRLVNSARGSHQIDMFMCIMRADRIAPFRGCYWHLSEEDSLDGESFRRLRGFADGSVVDGSLAQILVYKSTDLEDACLWLIHRFREIPGPVSRKPLDGAPWEIHLIADRAAYQSALAAYFENKV